MAPVAAADAGRSVLGYWCVGSPTTLSFSSESLKFSTTVGLLGTLPSSKQAESWSLPVGIEQN